MFPAGGLHGWGFAHCSPKMPSLGCLKNFALTSLLPWQGLVWKVPGPKKKAQMAQSNCYMCFGWKIHRYPCATKMLTCHWQSAPANRSPMETSLLLLSYCCCFHAATSFFSILPAWLQIKAGALSQGQVLPFCKACAQHWCLSLQKLQKGRYAENVVGSTSHCHKLLPLPAPVFKFFHFLPLSSSNCPFPRLWPFAASPLQGTICFPSHCFKALETLFTAKAASSSSSLAASMLTLLPCFTSFCELSKDACTDLAWAVSLEPLLPFEMSCFNDFSSVTILTILLAARSLFWFFPKSERTSASSTVAFSLFLSACPSSSSSTSPLSLSLMAKRPFLFFFSLSGRTSFKASSPKCPSVPSSMEPMFLALIHSKASAFWHPSKEIWCLCCVSL